jgi:hypothetical protein
MLISFEPIYQPQVRTRGRVGLFECECGCGKTFFATVKTRYPRYANKTHRARAYRARAYGRAMAQQMSLTVGIPQRPAGQESMEGTCGPCFDPYDGAGYEAHFDLAADSGWVPCAECNTWAPKEEMQVHDGDHFCRACSPYYTGEKRVCPECGRGVVVANEWAFGGDVCDECKSGH